MLRQRFKRHATATRLRNPNGSFMTTREALASTSRNVQGEFWALRPTAQGVLLGGAHAARRTYFPTRTERDRHFMDVVTERRPVKRSHADMKAKRPPQRQSTLPFKSVKPKDLFRQRFSALPVEDVKMGNSSAINSRPRAPGKTGRGIGRYAGQFRRPRRVGAKPAVKYTYESFGSVTRPNIAYFGVVDIGGPSRLLKPIVATMLIRLYARHKVYISDHYKVPDLGSENLTWDEIAFNLAYKNTSGITAFRTTTTTGWQANVSQIVQTSQTFDVQVENLLKQLVPIWTALENDFRVVSLQSLTSNSTGHVVIHTLDRLEDCIVSCFCTQVIDIQNQTASDTGSHDINSVNSNPLKGKLYKFGNALPRKRDLLTTLNLPFEAIGTKYDQGIIDTGTDGSDIYLTPDHSTGVVNPMFQPPHGRQIWKNCVGESNIRLPPGSHKKFVTKFKHTGRFNELLKKLARVSSVSYDNGNAIGKCYLLGLEPELRTITNENIVLGIQKEQYNSARIKFLPRPGLPSSTEMGGSLNV